jgi:site-specific DNA-methyltransferase (adenine-specific)/adenine-specific DNA-methyltransferase
VSIESEAEEVDADDVGGEGEPSRPYRLSEEQIEQITTRLRAGKALPPYLLPHLFERPRESELTYAGKMRAVDVLAETMALPLQAAKTFGDASPDAANMLILGDNLQVLKTLLEMKRRGELQNPDGTDGFRVCYIDPPFATRRDFQSSQGQEAYQDRVAGAEFIEFLRRRLIFIHELLSGDGTLYVHLDQKKGHYMKVVLDEIFGPSRFRNEIVWHYFNKMQGNVGRFPSNHDSIYAYGKGPRTYFEAVMEERPEAMQFIKRRWDQESGKLVNVKDEQGHVVYIERDDKRVDDVWRLSMLQPADRKERVDYPTQKPLTLLNIVIAASSKPGDLILDAFVGSGTTCVAAEQMGRRWVGIDCGKFAIYTAQARLLRLRERGLDPSFTTYNAGLYDYEALRELDWDAFREFALRLFQCRDEPQEIGGFRFDGILQDHPVHVFNFKAHDRDVSIGLPYIEDLISVAGAHLGDRCFIIAPALTVEPYEDYLDVEGTRFFFLRIPYSVIAELHKRAFSELRQPTSEQVANATIDAVGFDFVQTPSVECSYDTEGDKLIVQIKKFASQAYAADDAEDPIADLAMVMLDYEYDGEIFDLDAVHYSDVLASRDYRFEISASVVGDQLMLIYLDVFGNEYRESKTAADFASAG